ncbi:MAG: ribonuclease H-like domain-containing protein [Pirellulaceae bacterium]
MWSQQLRERLARLAQAQDVSQCEHPQIPPRPTNSSRDGRFGDTPEASSMPAILHDRLLRPAGRGPLDDGFEIENEAGRHWQLDKTIASLWPASEKYLADGGHVVPQSGDADYWHPEIEQFASSFPQGVAFLDLETCGFSGSMIFLAGVIVFRGTSLQLSQLWARNYAEEFPLLSTLDSLLMRHSVLVTFNGRSFDWPQVRDRLVLHQRGRLPLSEQLCHVDLLHHSRRKWRQQLPNFKLQTLERYVCGRNRTGDIPGREIPAAYHEYVRSGDTSQIGNILHHNALDLVTLLQLALCVGKKKG